MRRPTLLLIALSFIAGGCHSSSPSRAGEDATPTSSTSHYSDTGPVYPRA